MRAQPSSPPRIRLILKPVAQPVPAGQKGIYTCAKATQAAWHNEDPGAQTGLVSDGLSCVVVQSSEQRWSFTLERH